MNPEAGYEAPIAYSSPQNAPRPATYPHRRKKSFICAYQPPSIPRSRPSCVCAACATRSW